MTADVVPLRPSSGTADAEQLWREFSVLHEKLIAEAQAGHIVDMGDVVKLARAYEAWVRAYARNVLE